MVTVSLVEAKTQLSKLVDKAETGETVVITRHGRPVAHIIPAKQPKERIPLEELDAFRATLPARKGSSAAALRKLRDEGR
jgi:prevent-host-death family protein